MLYTQIEHDKFLIQVPESWMSIPSAKFDAVFVAPPFPEGAGTNVSLAVANSPEKISLADVSSQLKRTQEEQYPDYTVELEAEFLTPIGTGYVRKYTWLNTAQEILISHTQYVLLDDTNQKLCVITGTRLADLQPSEADNLDLIFHNVASSFRFNLS